MNKQPNPGHVLAGVNHTMKSGRFWKMIGYLRAAAVYKGIYRLANWEAKCQPLKHKLAQER